MPHIDAALTKVIPLNSFLDMVLPSSSEDVGQPKKTDNRNTSACRRSIQFNSIATQVAEKQFMQQAVGNTSNRICYLCV